METEDQGTETEEATEVAGEAPPAEEGAPVEEAAAAAEEVPAAEEAPAEEAEAPAEEAPATEEAPPEGAPAAEVTPAPEPSGPEDPDADLPWKERARRQRSRLPAEARPQRDPSERAAEREAQRNSLAAARRRRRQSARAESSEKGTGTPRAEHDPNSAKVRQGIVISDKGEKTITVRIDFARRHPTYEKVIRRSRTLHAHDERNEAGEGDVVRIVETRPLSKLKRWRLIEVVEKAE